MATTALLSILFAHAGVPKATELLPGEDLRLLLLGGEGGRAGPAEHLPSSALSLRTSCTPPPPPSSPCFPSRFLPVLPSRVGTAKPEHNPLTVLLNASEVALYY